MNQPLQVNLTKELLELENFKFFVLNIPVTTKYNTKVAAGDVNV